MTRMVWVLAAALAAVAGCTPGYRVHVNTYSELGEPLDRTAPIYVATDPNASNPILRRQIAGKIRDLLQGDGFNPTDSLEKATYVLTFEVGIDSERIMGYTYAPIYHRPFGGYYGGFYGSRFGWGLGYSPYMPYFETVYTHWLRMRLYAAQGAGATDRPATRQTVWLGEALVGTDSPEVRQAVNYLLAACTEYLGVDTKEWVSVRIDKDDPRIVGLSMQ